MEIFYMSICFFAAWRDKEIQCVCVCVKEREKERERSSKKDFQSRPCHNMTEKRKQLNKHAEIKNNTNNNSK